MPILEVLLKGSEMKKLVGIWIICTLGLLAQVSQMGEIQKVEIKSELEQALEFALQYEEDYKDQALEFLRTHYRILLDSQKSFCACNLKESKYCELIERVCYVSLDAPHSNNASEVANRIGRGTFLMNTKEQQAYNTLSKALEQKGEANPLVFIANRGKWKVSIDDGTVLVIPSAKFLVLGFHKSSIQGGLDFERDVRAGYEFLRKNLQYIDNKHTNAIDSLKSANLFWGQHIEEHTHCITKNLPSFDMLLSNGVNKNSILDMPQFGEKCSGGGIMGFVNKDTFIIAQIYSQEYYYGGKYYINSIVFVGDGDMMYVFLHSNPPPA